MAEINKNYHHAKKSKFVRKTSILILLIIQITFLSAIFRENFQSLWISISIIVMCPLIMVTYLKGQIHHYDHQYEHILVVSWIPIGAVSSFYVNHYLGLGPVIAAAAIGTLGSFVPEINKHSNYLKQVPAVMYCGAFIGMSNTRVAPDIFFILAASFFTAVLILVSKSLFSGVGGKLGTLAFTGVAITSFVYYLISYYV
ncbi:hypothetical protein [Flavobacterium quisquiliarum]|uniref:Uncharacterized protein n=1 Tax=Flavobacterium quisquiliarum TaxID=1834436 RepID=A0ABV8W3W5_9FLAO|nr:hypothetical protein [Flavobacterium quisquiliarum]